MENNTKISDSVVTLVGEELTKRYVAEGNNFEVTGNASNLKDFVFLAESGEVTVKFKGEANEDLTIYVNKGVELTVEGAEFTELPMTDLVADAV